MNDYQWELWEDLMYLVETSEAFFYSDQELNDRYYRIFNYRLASYTDFQARNALECRGHMFEIDKAGPTARPSRLVALPMEKFFNVGENPFTMDLDFDNPMQIMLKEDGSLISSFLHTAAVGKLPVVMCKSKGSLSSDQATDATWYLHELSHYELRDDIYRLEHLGCTVNMEYTAPHNRIVIGYEEENLVVLNVRDRSTGKYIPKDQLSSYHALQAHWVKEYEPDEHDAYIVATYGMTEWVNRVECMEGIEGFVIQLANGQHVKKKTLWYLALHHTKDSINNPRRLFEAVLEEASDDLRTLFADDKLAVRQIEEMEQRVEKLYNHMVDQVERFYEHNKHLERKDYAILGQEELDRMYFSLAMNKYVGKEVKYKEFLKGKWKQLGFKDEKLNDE